jgi:uncharacterized protein (TIGR03435 family)
MTFRDLITRAYRIQRDLVSGPSWIDADRFDIVAKVPQGATFDQTTIMWQELLKERFQLALNRQTKEMPIYALLINKGGPKRGATWAPGISGRAPERAQRVRDVCSRP